MAGLLDTVLVTNVTSEDQKPKRPATHAEQVKRVAVKALREALDREARAKHSKEIAAHFVTYT